MSRIGVVGAGTAGLAAAALLARAGHAVEVLERAPDPGPVGAGLLLQPTGIAVLERLGVLDEVRPARPGSTRSSGRRSTAGASWTSPTRGWGRASTASACTAARCSPRCAARRERAGAVLLPGVEVVQRRGGALIDAGGARYGPYDLLVGADGARSTMRRFLPVRARIHEHRWGALWGVFADPDGTFDGRLDQYFDGARRMVGFLPTGSSAVSLFWSVRLDRIEAVRAAGIDAFRDDLLVAGARGRADRRRDRARWTSCCPRPTARSRCRAGTTGRSCCSATPRTRSARSSARARTSR